MRKGYGGIQTGIYPLLDRQCTTCTVAARLDSAIRLYVRAASLLSQMSNDHLSQTAAENANSQKFPEIDITKNAQAKVAETRNRATADGPCWSRSGKSAGDCCWSRKLRSDRHTQAQFTLKAPATHTNAHAVRIPGRLALQPHMTVFILLPLQLHVK
jgi:hypothetical protein